jgi:hypothetical protein
VKRPGSLAEVVTRAGDLRDFHYSLADFLDQFAIEKRASMLATEPARLVDRFPNGDVGDAYLAAVAVALARTIGSDPPLWSWHASRKLRRPWFAHPGAALRATLLSESPAPFRERNLFVSANALSRA